VVGGIICALGWYTWMAICLMPSSEPDDFEWDCHNHTSTAKYVVPCQHKAGAYWAPGILMTIGVIMLNVISWESLTEDGMDEGCGVAAKAKGWVMFTFILMFCALGGSLWILISDAIDKGKEGKDKIWMGPGAGVLVQCACLFIGGLVFRVVRREGDNSI